MRACRAASRDFCQFLLAAFLISIIFSTCGNGTFETLKGYYKCNLKARGAEPVVNEAAPPALDYSDRMYDPILHLAPVPPCPKLLISCMHC